MRVSCTNCEAVYKIDPSKIPAKGTYVKCRKCQTRFFLSGKSASPKPAPEAKREQQENERELKKAERARTEQSEKETAVGSDESPKGIESRRTRIIFGVGIFALLALLVFYFGFFKSDSHQRRRTADNFLKALKNKKLRADNAFKVNKEYKIDLLALNGKNVQGRSKQDIYFPIALLDYKFLSEEVVPQGFETHSLGEMIEIFSRVEEPVGGASTIKEFTGFFIQSNNQGDFFIIKGMITNNLPETQSYIQIKGTLQDDKGIALKTKTVCAGNTLTETQIKEKSLDEIDKTLSNQSYKGDINPGETVPFLIVFGNLPENIIGAWKVEAVGQHNEPDKEVIKTAKHAFELLKKELKAKNPRQLKIDEGKKIISYYNDAPGSYKLHYLLSLTNRLGTTLKKNGYVTIEKGYNKGNEIVEFKWEE